MSEFDDELYPLGAPDRPRVRRRPGAGDLIATVVSFVLAALFAAVATFGVLISGLAYDGCGSDGVAPRCTYGLFDAAVLGHPIADAVVIAAGIVLAIRRRRSAHASWPIALATIGVVVVVSVVAFSMSWAGSPAGPA